jgi:hypothetical protein
MTKEQFIEFVGRQGPARDGGDRSASISNGGLGHYRDWLGQTHDR